MSGVKCPTSLDSGQDVRQDVRTMATIKELREATGRSRARVASDLDMSERHLARLENGEQAIRRVHALAFANYFGVELKKIDGQAEVAA
jgi:transcriptional regulator with XRE-family HTH domain